MKKDKITLSIAAPENVTFSLDADMLVISGPKGSISKKMAAPNVNISLEDNKLIFYSAKPTKKEKRMIGTYSSHARNMIRGVTHGYNYKLKVSSGHFPISVSVKNDVLEIKNFFGERKPRTAKILDDVKVSIKGEIIELTGYDLEKVSQTAANIEQATRITNRDKRVFMDRINIISKDES